MVCWILLIAAPARRPAPESKWAWSHRKSTIDLMANSDFDEAVIKPDMKTALDELAERH